MAARAAAVLLALLVGALAAGDQASRRLHQEPTGCQNTVSGRWYVTDDRGTVCPRDTFDYTTGCCTTGEQFSCATCEAEDKCCSQYEHCVSCCLKPENQPEQHVQSIFRGRNKPETGHWSTPFEYCQAVCRTTARSTQHENAFILDRKHCFSKLGRPHVPVPPAPPLPHGAVFLAGELGQSCTVVCAAKQMGCRDDLFASINDCNSLRAKFMCEAGCGSGAPDQKHFPGYIQGRAPKHLRPAYCATLPPFPGHPAPGFNCSRGSGTVRRLCPCEPLPGMSQAVQVDAAEGAATQQPVVLAGAAGADAATAGAAERHTGPDAGAAAAAAAAELPGEQQAQPQGAADPGAAQQQAQEQAVLQLGQEQAEGQAATTAK